MNLTETVLCSLIEYIRDCASYKKHRIYVVLVHFCSLVLKIKLTGPQKLISLKKISDRALSNRFFWILNNGCLLVQGVQSCMVYALTGAKKMILSCHYYETESF